MTRKQFQTAAVTRDVVEFDVDDDTYHFTPPKKAALLLNVLDVDPDDPDDGLAGMRSTFDWLSQGLPADENDRLVARLRDPDDGFDVDDLAAVVRWLVSETTGRPTQ